MIWISRQLYGYFKVGKRIVSRPLRNSFEYYLKNSQDKQISSWIDLQLKIEEGNVTVVNQIPKQSSAKMQMMKEVPKHPIMQDTRLNKYVSQLQLRHYAIPLPQINYGFIPQTWQQNIKRDANGYLGDNDPIDVIDISKKQREILDINQLKVLCSFCLIDQGQLDWKIIAIDPQEAKQERIQSYKNLPINRLQEIMNWFKIYKTYDGKKQNQIAFNGKIFNQNETINIIHQTHQDFKKLIKENKPEYTKRKQQYHIQ